MALPIDTLHKLLLAQGRAVPLTLRRPSGLLAGQGYRHPPDTFPMAFGDLERLVRRAFGTGVPTGAGL